MEIVMNDVAILKRNQAVQGDTPNTSTRDSSATKEMKEFQDWWKTNLTSMNGLKQQIDVTCMRIEEAHTEAAEIFESVKETKADLKQWYSSMFCREDSEKLQKIYNRLNDEKVELCDCTLDSSHTDPMKTMPLDADVHPTAPPPEFRDHDGSWVHPTRFLQLDNFPPLTQSVPPPVIGTDLSISAKKMQRDQSSSSRRSSGFSMTYSARAPSRSGYSTVVATPAPFSSQQNSAAAGYVVNNKGPYTDKYNNIDNNTDNNFGRQSPVSARKYPSQTPNFGHVKKTTERDWLNPPPNQTSVGTRATLNVFDRGTVNSNRVTGSGVSTSSRTPAVTTPKPREFTTVLITDSIMKNIKLNDLGVNHSVHMIRKRDSTGLINIDVRNALKRLNPDFIYVHIGINDIFADRPIKHIMINFNNLITAKNEVARNAKIIFSLPLLTDNNRVNELVKKLRWAIHDLTTNLAYETHDEELKYRELLVNANDNLDEGNDLFEEDGVHLSARGQRIIRSNFRCGIHTLTRAILGKPWKRPERVRIGQS
jgi:lysophospholipase L1-like esterase